MMPVDIMLTVVFTAIVQSIFGTGVLLFGTPILLLSGYQFIDTLVTLLPISLVISGMQIARDGKHIDLKYYRQILWLTLPPIALFLILVIHTQISIGIVIGGFLLFIALRSFSTTVADLVDKLMKYQKSYFVLMGIVHGVSNLGGSLLTAAVHHRNYPKNVARVTVAASYATFAVVQLFTLLVFSRQQVDVSYYDNIVYVAVASLVFEMSDDILFLGMDQRKYQRLFSAFLAISGAVLIGKSI